MNVSIKEISATVRTLEVSISQDDLKPAFEKKVTECRKEVQMKGFRPGQVPRNLIVARFGEGLRSEAIDDTINNSVRDELAKANIVPVAKGKLDKFQDDKVNPITFTLTIEVDPPIEIKGYKETGYNVPTVVVNEVEVTDELNHLRNIYGDRKPVERAAQKGDFVEGLYLEVVIDGEVRALPENPEFRSVIGDSTTPGFDEGLIGATKGEVKTILFTYPMEHKDVEYAGKSAQFKVDVTNVAEVTLPELDDEFAKKLGLDTLANLKERIAENLSTQRTNQAKAKAQEEAIDFLISKNPFEVAETRVNNWIAHQLHKNEQHEEEHEHEEHEHEEPSAEQKQAMGPQAVREIKKFRILEYIVKTETLKPTQADVDARIQAMALQYGIEFEALKANLRQSGRISDIREDLKFQKALDLIVGA